ncbi:hypothetical protein P175DRAFT_0495392 [Aspergillus ochraceoroseus IBT 24754]|uniref:Zn(2)-C6 fungal-type domain-containing protein n=3 Tax=Aspergillus subgen. Nidulantes TaxID=2720870 RepID=A0A0F8WV97_9EURO|nr:uncharacterized protein P175DRAFT_0495392 [Aspergillus ochraceoroseus IBT 24754]KKK15202.1 hypothetical protein ARAM_002021 [Aspergillus rambellii]KKK15419.1 hypothetical protein AOCH_001144 [Aspergillus ochraceoroseus]PTU17983.1 hypothetical protein P175DRAFT_0495392 [Aspergillus ochraceoroseus IBT 24754]
MPGVPSNKACERCKKRHLKCDETRPQCQRCTTAGVECPGYVQTRKFIDQGASVRRRYAPYPKAMSNPGTSKNTETVTRDQTPRLEQNAEKQPANQGQSGLELAKLSTHLQGQSGFQSTLQTPSQISPDTPLHPDLPGHMTNEPGTTRVLSFGPSGSGSSSGPPQNSLTPNSASIDPSTSNVFQEYRQQQQPSPNAMLPPSTSPSQRSDKEEFQDIFSELMTGTEHEISFLIRHFSEVLADWLDLSDTGKFFQAYVPIRALDEPFLKFSIAALSAKHLGRMKGVKFASASGMFTSPAATETYPNALQTDWFLKAANYYYLAASRMNSSISDTYGSVSTSVLLESSTEIASRWLDLHLKKPETARQEGPAGDNFWKKIENLLAASSILTLYKILDEPGESWQTQLTGVGKLFDKLIELIGHASVNTPVFSHGITAAFWNFARLDYYTSYFNRLPTLFDAENIVLWRAAGIPLDDQGNLSTPTEAVPHKMAFFPEDLAGNIMTWLLNKVTNFLVASKRSQLEHWVGQSSSESTSPGSSNAPSPHPYPNTATWLKLSFEFQSWIERIPETFRPSLRLEQPKNPTKSPEGGHVPFPETFYGLTCCATTMQQYHFGRLALSLNRPSDEVAGPSTAFDRLQGYRELTKEVDHRCREICGIALGRPHGAARIHMITLLFAVGQCLEKQQERQIILDLLRGIEADLGWVTSFHIQKLQKIWEDRT